MEEKKEEILEITEENVEGGNDGIQIANTVKK